MGEMRNIAARLNAECSIIKLIAVKGGVQL